MTGRELYERWLRYARAQSRKGWQVSDMPWEKVPYPLQIAWEDLAESLRQRKCWYCGT